MTAIEIGGRLVELYDLTPAEAAWLVNPAGMELLMMMGGPLRARPSTKCYRGNGFDVHVQPDCRCRR